MIKPSVENYSVWVGQWKANDCSVTAYLAEAIKDKWENQGYTNVVIKEDN